MKEKKSRKDYLQSWSSSLSDDPNCTDVVNKNLPVRVLDLYSDDRSDDTSHVRREQAPINVSSASTEITSDSSPETIVNSKPAVDSGGSETPVPRLNKEKTIRDWIYDPRLYIVSGLLLVCQRNLPTHHVSNISYLRSCYDHPTN